MAKQTLVTECYHSDLLAKACPAISEHIDDKPYIHVLVIGTNEHSYTFISYIWDTREITKISTLNAHTVYGKDLQAFLDLPMQVKQDCQLHASDDNNHMLHGNESITAEYINLLADINLQIMNFDIRTNCHAFANLSGEVALYRKGWAVIFNEYDELLRTGGHYDNFAEFNQREGNDFQKTKITETMRFWLMKQAAVQPEVYDLMYRGV